MSCAPSSAIETLAGRLARAGLSPFPFQLECWRRLDTAQAMLVLAPTGAGKTLAALGGFLARGLAAPPASGLRLLWVTPLRALAADIARAAAQLTQQAGLRWRTVLRTGDAADRAKRRARAGEAELIVTTPESLALLLSHADFQQACSGLWGVVCDEWHELLGSKRGVLLELALARLRRLAPGLLTLALSASIGNEQLAARALAAGREVQIIRAGAVRPVEIETLLPDSAASLSWSGHLGLSLLPALLPRLVAARSSLVFANTRAQAEQWHAALAAVWPGAPGALGLHHGSLAPAHRAAVEEGLRNGRLQAVVATSSLDLGVDLPRVEQVVQIGSPKGIARLLQRAGRARHRPGEPARLLFVPTNAWELVEIVALRSELAAGRIEARAPLRLCLDVLAQHLTTLALAEPLDPERAFAEVRDTYAFAELAHADFESVLAMLEHGGSALARYPGFARLKRRPDGRLEPASAALARDHRMAIGTIVGDDQVSVVRLNGQRIGEVEARFVDLIQPGDCFRLGGETLELVMVREDRVLVRRSKEGKGVVPRWMGGRMPLSVELGAALLGALRQGEGPEIEMVRPMLTRQAQLSALPGTGELLCEVMMLAEGWHLFLYPFAGRELHAGLATLIAARLPRPALAFAVNDYGLLLILSEAPPAGRIGEWFAHPPQESELAGDGRLERPWLRRFHENALVAGLIKRAPAGAVRSQRHLRISTRLLFEALRRYDPEHPLLLYARREMLERDLDLPGLSALLDRLRGARLIVRHPARLTPLAFPLYAERLRAELDPREAERAIRLLAEQLEEAAR